MKWSVLVLCALLSCACGFLAAEGTAADRAFVLETLKAHSPDGYWIVDSYRKQLPGGTDFMEYWDSDPAEKWESINTIVHEIAHGVMGELADPDCINLIVSRDQSFMVPVTAVFPTVKMAPQIPKELRTFRFDTYVGTPSPSLGSQVQGAYGLLDEMAAYYLGTKTSWDLRPLFLAKPKTADWQAFFNSVNASLYGILEFRFFVLKYLMYAQKSEPKTFKAIMANKVFADAFRALDARAAAFVADYLSGKGGVYATMEKAGYRVSETIEFLEIGKGGSSTYIGTFMEVYELLRKEMLKDDYQRMLVSLCGTGGVSLYPAADASGNPGSPPPEGNWEEEGSEASWGEDDAATAAPPDALSAATEDRPDPADGAADGSLYREAEDREGDAGRDFMDILNVVIQGNAAGLRVDIVLAGLPPTLPFNAGALKPDYQEYAWTVLIDGNADGDPDYALSLSHFKPEKSKPLTGKILDICQADLWEIGGGNASLLDIPVSASISGDAIRLAVDYGEGFSARDMGETAAFSVQTSFNDGKASASDELEF